MVVASNGASFTFSSRKATVMKIKLSAAMLLLGLGLSSVSALACGRRAGPWTRPFVLHGHYGTYNNYTYPGYYSGAIYPGGNPLSSFFHPGYYGY